MRSLERSIRRALVGAFALGLGISACKETVTEPIAVAAVVVNGGGGSLRLGQSVQLSTTLKSTEGWTLPNVGVSWTSSDAAKANISPSGQVTAVSRGPVTLTASAGGVNGTAAVTVIGVQSISLAPETLSVIVTQTRAMTATTVLDPGVTVTPTWRSLDTTIARVGTDGRVTARTTTGFARVEVTAEDKKDTAVVRVVPVPVVSVVVTPDTATRGLGETVQLIATPRDSIGGALTGRTVTWSSSDTSKATVSTTGLVTGVTEGVVSITATIEQKTATASIRIQDPPGLRVRLRGPSGTGFFFVRLTGANNNSDSWHRLVAQNDTAVLNVAQNPGSSFAIRVYAVDARTNNLQQAGGWVRVIGVWKRSLVTIEQTARTVISATVPIVSITEVQAPESVDAFTQVPVKWQVADSTGMIREMANHHLSYGDQPFGDGTIGPGRRDATQVANSQGLVTFTSSIPAQEVDGVRYWRMVHWQEVGGTIGPLILSLSSPSVTNGDQLRQLQVKPVPQGLRLSLRGPAGTGSFFLNVLGSGLPQGGVWRRINGVIGDTANVQQMLPVGSNYQVRLFAVDAQTDPERTVGGWVALTAVGRIAATTIQSNVFNLAAINAQPISITNVEAPDSVYVDSPVPVSWEVSDTTGIIHAFANKFIGYDAAPWSDGQIGPGRVDATATLVAQNRYTYSASVPAQRSPAILSWKISMFEEVNALFGTNRLSVVMPSITWRAEAPRYVKVQEQQKMVDIDAGDTDGCGIARSGKIYCWGAKTSNGAAPLEASVSVDGFRGDTSRVNACVIVLGDECKASRIAVGTNHACAITTTGQTICWKIFGTQMNGQLGTGTAQTDGLVSGGGNFVSISAGGSTTCALDIQGAAYCWGRNSIGQIGDSTLTDRYVPVLVKTSIRFAQLSVGTSHVCGVSTSKQLYCWGDNSIGQLGVSDSFERLQPTRTSPDMQVVEVSAGKAMTCARSQLGLVYCVGSHSYKALGEVVSQSQKAFIQPISLTRTYSTVASSSRETYNCAVSTEGVGNCWGENYSGQFGNGLVDPGQSYIGIVAINQKLKKIVAGYAVNYALTSDGKVWGWGKNESGQLGIGVKFEHTGTPRSIVP